MPGSCSDSRFILQKTFWIPVEGFGHFRARIRILLEKSAPCQLEMSAAPKLALKIMKVQKVFFFV